MSASDDMLDRLSGWVLSEKGGGISSRCLLAIMTGMKPSRTDSPRDSWDLGRCIRLLHAVPEWRERIGEMAAVSQDWARLVAIWSALEALFRAETEGKRDVWAPRTYDLMTGALYRRPLSPDTKNTGEGG